MTFMFYHVKLRDSYKQKLLKALRQTTLEYLFGEGRIVSRSNAIAVAGYFLNYPNSTLNFKSTRDIIKASSVPEHEKNDIYKLFDTAKLTWKPKIEKVLQNISQTLVGEEAQNEDDDDILGLDPDLPDGPTGSIAGDINSYTNFRASDYKKCENVTFLKLTKNIIISFSHDSESY